MDGWMRFLSPFCRFFSGPSSVLLVEVAVASMTTAVLLRLPSLPEVSATEDGSSLPPVSASSSEEGEDEEPSSDGSNLFLSTLRLSCLVSTAKLSLSCSSRTTSSCSTQSASTLVRCHRHLSFLQLTSSLQLTDYLCIANTQQKPSGEKRAPSSSFSKLRKLQYPSLEEIHSMDPSTFHDISVRVA